MREVWENIVTNVDILVETNDSNSSFNYSISTIISPGKRRKTGEQNKAAPSVTIFVEVSRRCMKNDGLLSSVLCSLLIVVVRLTSSDVVIDRTRMFYRQTNTVRYQGFRPLTHQPTRQYTKWCRWVESWNRDQTSQHLVCSVVSFNMSLLMCLHFKPTSWWIVSPLLEEGKCTKDNEQWKADEREREQWLVHSLPHLYIYYRYSSSHRWGNC